ncbi:MAG: STAS domain-containing protein, partial [Calditrichaeota bacterium]
MEIGSEEKPASISSGSRETGWAYRLGPAFTAGLVNGVLILIFQSAYAALIFSGPLTPFLGWGIGIMLYGAAVMGLTMALLSSFPGTVTAPQDAPSAIFAVVAGGIAGNLSLAASPEIAFVSAVAALAVTSLFTGIFFLLLGWFRLGNLVRFIPYPVVGGFLAGTGWVLVKGAVGITGGEPVSLTNLAALFRPEVLMHWIPGALFGLLLFGVRQRFGHFLVLPGMIVLAFAVFYGVLGVAGISPAEAARKGWLLSRLAEGIAWKPFLPEMFRQIQWSAVASQVGNLGTIVVISVISLLLNSSGLELIARREVDLNRELRATGLANVLSGIGGSAVGYISLSLTALGYRLGSRSRLSAMVSAGICGFSLLSGAAVSSYFPRPLLGGLLIFLGITFLVEWLYRAWFRLPLSEYLVVVLILITIAALGFVEGMLLGMIISVVLFSVNYGRVGVVKHVLSGATYRSNVDRPLSHRRVLEERGEEILILKLQGYIFFGTAHNVLDQVKQRLTDAHRPPVRFVALDFYRVSGMDSSALHSFEKMKLFAEQYGATLVFTSPNASVRRLLEVGGLWREDDSRLRVFPDLDHGAEWMENRILKEAETTRRISLSPEDNAAFLAGVMQEHLSSGAGEPLDASRLAPMMAYWEPRTYEAGAYLIRQGDPPRGIFLIKSGQVTVQLEEKDHRVLRLRTMQAGTVVGEMGVYLGLPATASVVADHPCAVLLLAPEKLRQM